MFEGVISQAQSAMASRKASLEMLNARKHEDDLR
jgi:hypothetical protein